MRLYGPRTNTKKRKKRMNNNIKYFQLEEFLDSSVARQKSISNLPSWDIIEHLRELGFFLDDLREAWGSGINVSSGYRNEALNKAVGGVQNSVHQIGYAADIVPANGKFKEFAEFVENWAKDKAYDQIIVEKSKKTKWIHIGLYNNNHKQRRMCFLMDVK